MACNRTVNISRRSSRESAALSYWEQSKQPLQVLAFLLPLIVFYELGLVLVLQSEDGKVLSNVAHVTLLEFFNMLGIEALSGMYLGGIAIVVVLLVWHLLLHGVTGSWRIHGRTLGGMAAESVVLTLPLIVLGLLITRSAISLMATSPEQQLAEMDIWSRLSISIGAGLYEELMFRMLLIAVLHALLVDLAGLRNVQGAVLSVILSAAAFAWYHPLAGADGHFSMQKLIFYFAAGLYFGLVFIVRGFGIVVAVHTLYDVAMMLPAAD